jgi:hypothetical protein
MPLKLFASLVKLISDRKLERGFDYPLIHKISDVLLK